MTDDFEAHLHTLFAGASRDLPANAFAAAVATRVRAHRRRVRLLQGAGVLISVLIVWLLAPDVASVTATLDRLPAAASQLATRSLRTLSESPALPLLYLYGGTLVVSLLLRLLHRSRIRFA